MKVGLPVERGHQALPPLKLFTSENSTPSSSVLSHRSVVLHTKPLAFSPAVAQAPFSSSHKVGDARFGSCLAKAGWGSNLSLAMTMPDQTMSNEKRMMRPFQNKQISFFYFFCHCQNHSWFHTQPQPCVSRVWFHSRALTSAVKPQPAELSCACSKAISSRSPQNQRQPHMPSLHPNAAAHRPDHCLSQQNEDFWWQKTSKHHLNFVILQRQGTKLEIFPFLTALVFCCAIHNHTKLTQHYNFYFSFLSSHSPWLPLLKPRVFPLQRLRFMRSKTVS